MKCGEKTARPYGPGRWHCNACRYTFRPHKKHRHADRRWLASYLLDGSPFRRLGERWGVSGTTAWRRIQRTQDVRIKTGTLIVRSACRDVRILMLDGKHFMIRKKPFTLYVAFDAEKKIPVAWIFLPRYELRDGYDRLLSHLVRENAAVVGIVSDWGTGVRASVHDHFPNVVHQHCAFHVLADTLRKLGGRKFIHTDYGRDLWHRVRRMGIGCDTLAEARQALGALKRTHPDYLRVWNIFDRQLPSIYEFTKESLLEEFRTSNRMENFMGVLEQRLKSFRTMKTPDTCIKIISSFIAAKYKIATKK